MLTPNDFFDLENNVFKDLFDGAQHVWEPLSDLEGYIQKKLQPNVSKIRGGNTHIKKTTVLLDGEIIDSSFIIESSKKGVVVKKDGKILEGASVIFAGANLMDDKISIGRNTVIEPAALIRGPSIIGDNTEIRHGCYVRGNVLIGNDCVVGHSTEIKSSIMLGESKAGHFAYIGNSILGKVNLGAGTKLANLKVVQTQIVLKIEEKEYETGLRKFGAILADGVETGCNSVTTPGTLLGKNAILYPNATARGFYASDCVVKVRQTHKIEKRR